LFSKYHVVNVLLKFIIIIWLAKIKFYVIKF
jgi:hypothetical protein